MSEIEEPPTKVLKVDHEEEAAVSDTTEVTNVTEESEMPEALDSQGAVEESEMPEALDSQEAVEESEMPEALDSQEAVEESEMPEALDSQEAAEMAEERLQDSLDSQDSQDVQDSQDAQESQESQEGQEEWLSEDVLTDDDFNPAAEVPDRSESQTSQVDNTQHETPNTDNPIESEQTEEANTDPSPEETVAKPAEQNIEDALNTLEGGPEKEMDLPEDLDAFLVKKTNVKPKVAVVKTENAKEEDDDGNDTDELLRMLSEDNNKSKKKLTKTVKDIRSSIKEEQATSEDDDFVYEGVPSKKIKLATSSNNLPKKAEPEDMGDEDTDASVDEVETMQKMFAARKSERRPLKPQGPARRLESRDNSIPSVVERSRRDKLATSTPLRSNKPRSLLKPTIPTPRAAAAAIKTPAYKSVEVKAPAYKSVELKTPSYKSVQVKKEPNPNTYSRFKTKPAVKPPTPIKSSSILKPVAKSEMKLKPDEVNDHEEFLEEEEYHLDEEEFESDFDDEMDKSQRIKKSERTMKPAHMDEEEPSDAESHSEDGSLYDELPSSDSEDMDDWFQLDIRAEKAGDYLPLLGPKAKELLLEEKRRIASRLSNLKQSLCALTDSGKKQAEQVRTATMALAELDDMLKAS